MGPNQSGNLPDSDSEIHDRLVQYASSVFLQGVLPGFSSEMDEKLFELVRECEEIYDMTNNGTDGKICLQLERRAKETLTIRG
jgi:hypothetical protein